MGKYLPIFVNIEGKRCVVVGGGKVAERKVLRLLKFGAQVTVVSPEITKRLSRLAEEGKIEYRRGKYDPRDIENALLVVAATSDRETNQRIVRDAKFLVNSVDGDLSTNSSNLSVIFPAIFERASLQIAISTEFPALSSTIRDELRRIYGREFANYVQFLRELRNELREKVVDSKRRREIFRKIASQVIVAKLRQKGFKRVKEELKRIVNEA